jgi:hypothetical protein
LINLETVHRCRNKEHILLTVLRVGGRAVLGLKGWLGSPISGACSLLGQIKCWQHSRAAGENKTNAYVEGIRQEGLPEALLSLKVQAAHFINKLADINRLGKKKKSRICCVPGFHIQNCLHCC